MRHTIIAAALLASVANCAFAQVASSDNATAAAAKSDPKNKETMTSKAKAGPSGKTKPPKTNEVSRSPDVRGTDVNLQAPHTAKSTSTVAPDKK